MTKHWAEKFAPQNQPKIKFWALFWAKIYQKCKKILLESGANKNFDGFWVQLPAWVVWTPHGGWGGWTPTPTISNPAWGCVRPIAFIGKSGASSPPEGSAAPAEGVLQGEQGEVDLPLHHRLEAVVELVVGRRGDLSGPDILL